MQSVFTLTFALALSLTVLAKTNRFELGLEQYELLNLDSALAHFEAAEAELSVTNQNQVSKTLLAKTLLYQAATYFLLNELDTAKKKTAKALELTNTCSADGLKLPSLLYDYCLQLLQEKKSSKEDQAFQSILHIPKEISQNNLESVFRQNQQKSQLRQTGSWMMISSSLPLGLGLGFGIGALFAKQEYITHPNFSAQEKWKNYALLTDASLACGVALAATGLILYLLNQEGD